VRLLLAPIRLVALPARSARSAATQCRGAPWVDQGGAGTPGTQQDEQQSCRQHKERGRQGTQTEGTHKDEQQSCKEHKQRDEKGVCMQGRENWRALTRTSSRAARTAGFRGSRQNNG